MRYVLSIVLPLCAFSAYAQTADTYTRHLRQQKAGAGTVTVTQDAEIEALVNNEATKKKEEKPPLAGAKQEKPAHRQTPERRLGMTGSRQRYKAKGYRIQIFTGGNSRTDRQAARRMEQKCKKAFPELSAYVHFVSPRWICRVGDFRTREDANKYLHLIRKAKISNEARVVSCTVLLAY